MPLSGNHRTALQRALLVLVTSDVLTFLEFQTVVLGRAKGKKTGTGLFSFGQDPYRIREMLGKRVSNDGCQRGEIARTKERNGGPVVRDLHH